jgi:CHASE2 domain-containing sensor protein
VLLTVDDKTLARRHIDVGGGRVLPRDDYARLVSRLHADGAAAIAVDVIFQGPGEPRGDRALLDAIRATRDRLVLPFTDFTVVGNNPSVVRPRLLGDPLAVKASRVRTGYAGLPLDKDDYNRRADYQVVIDPTKGLKIGGEVLTAPSFAFAAADVARQGELRRQLARLPTASRRVDKDQSTSTTWIDYRGPPGTVRRVSALDLFDGRVEPGAFRDKIVVVGRIAPRTKVPEGSDKDMHRTPFVDGASMPGPEVQANALATMLRGAPLRDVSQLVDILAIVLLACVAAVAGLSRSRALAAVAIAATALIFLAAAQLAFNGGWIVAVVLPLLALAVSTLAVTALAAARIARSRAARRRGATDDGLSPV